MLVLILCAALAVMMIFPDTPTGKTLRRLLVEAPARTLSRLTPGHLLIALALIGMSVLVAALFETEGLRLLGMALPEGLAWLAAFDVATFLDIFAAAAMIAATARLRALQDLARSARTWARSLASRIPRTPRRAGRGRRRRSPRPGSPPAKGDDGEGAWPAAWAPAWA
ncbi:hypothetical protein [Caulobacter sp.]|uniref:hypothetical protein n=1 Tax=Caulobacter sp. TaxID=78 RepID=UPI003BAA9492